MTPAVMTDTAMALAGQEEHLIFNASAFSEYAWLNTTG
jgi:hypothetical protein